MSSTKGDWVGMGVGMFAQADDLKRREMRRLAATLQDESIPAEQREQNRRKLLEIANSIDDEFTTDYEGDD